MLIDVGHVVAGKYELVRLLGRGSMGEVWVAHHNTLQEHVALKLLTQAPEGEEVEDAGTAAARFRFEAQVAARLSRKTRHIVRVTDHGDEGELAYLVMELLEGQTLEAALVRGDGRIPFESVPQTIAQIGRALTQAHAEGVLHRDLKPANVFLMRDEEGELLVKLLDFGIARAIHAHRVSSPFSTARGLVFGTPGYMSPEQATGSAKLDHRCDLWALATIAYETLTGELPVPGSDASELLKNLCAGRIVPVRERNPELPQALDKFFECAFADSVDARFASASELVEAFERATEAEVMKAAALASSQSAPGVTVPVEEATRDRSTSPPPRRVPRLRVSVLGAAALLGVAAVGGAWRVIAGSPRAVTSPPALASSPPAMVPSADPSAALAPPTVAIPDEPATPVSALPRATQNAPAAGHATTRDPPAIPAARPTATVAPAATPPPQTPAAPAVSAKPVDKSEVL
jgi:serine/threonine-protein kinase